MTHELRCMFCRLSCMRWEVLVAHYRHEHRVAWRRATPTDGDAGGRGR